MSLGTGSPKTEVKIVDYSQIASSEKLGKICIPIVCGKGEPGKVYDINSTKDRRRYLGNEVAGYRDIYELDRALGEGRSFYATRIHHYSDVAAGTLASGVKASNEIGTEVTTILCVADVADNLNGKYFLIWSANNAIKYKVWYKTGAALSEPVVADSVGAQVTVATGATAAQVATATALVLDALAAFAAPAPGAATITVTNSAQGKSTNATANTSGFTLTTTVTNSLLCVAKGVGPDYDGIIITSVAAASGLANKFDITVTLPGGDSDLSKTFYDVAYQVAGVDLDKLNASSVHVDFSLVGQIVAGTTTLQDGTYLTGSIVDADVIGHGTPKSGFYAFDSTKDAVRMCVFGYASPTIDVALAAYCVARGDMRFHLATPLAADADDIVDYRMGSGAYSHVAVDTYYGSMWTGGLRTSDPVTGLQVTHRGMGNVVAAYGKKDEIGKPNLSPSQPQFGSINDSYVLGVALDFGPGSMVEDYGKIYNKGVNAVIVAGDGYPKLHGNRSLQKANTLLQKENNAEYIVSLQRRIKKIIDVVQFQPNDPIMWRELYNAIKPLLKSDEKDRAIEPGEDSGWKYIGDQFANSASEAVFNDADDIQNGIYKFRILVKPISAVEYIGLEIGVVNSKVNFEIVQLPIAA